MFRKDDGRKERRLDLEREAMLAGKVNLNRVTMTAGDKVCRWTLLTPPRYIKPKREYCLCRCECGVEKEVRYDGLKNGRSSSCGCLMEELAKMRMTIHGWCPSKTAKPTPEWRTWCDMIQRCTNPNKENFKDYGGRGITVCDSWLESFENFIKDMGLRPKGIVKVRSQYSIERRNNSNGYGPDNCYWATTSEQMVNRRNSIKRAA